MKLFRDNSKAYLEILGSCFTEDILSMVEILANDLLSAWIEERNVFICGNGGSAANAIHIANDLHYGIGACGPGTKIPGLMVEALTANQGIVTCLANDIGYDNIFSHQLQVKGKSNDLVIMLSGSGNSLNIIKALEVSRNMGLKTYAILAYNGGKCKDMADQAIHFPVNDMQIAEDTQLIIGHLCMQWLNNNKPQKNQLK